MRSRETLNKKTGGTFWPLFLLVCSGLLLSIFIPNHFMQKKCFAAELSTADCIKCHATVQATVDSKGAKHKTAVNCLNCHKGHPPMVAKEKIIPACDQCHAGKPHYQISGCNTCHSDPHAPLDMKLAANLTDPCLSCHNKQGQEMKEHPSQHSKFFCTTCHKAHRQIPSCLTCHRPHSSEMVNKDCLICHPAHQPLTITYGADMPNKQCAVCHKSISDKLTGTDTKHAKLACAFCHKERHKNVPACETCHGTPHPSGMLAQFPKCNMCHISAHSLGKEAKK